MAQPHNVDDIGQLYDNSAQSYERAIWLPEHLFLNNWREQLFSKAFGKILEIGVGSGKNLQYFPAGSEVVGIDLSPAMLALATERAKSLPIKASFLKMDAEHLDFPDATFDTVTSSLSLCIFPEPLKVLREIARVCRPGGRIIMLEHGRSKYARFAHFQDQREAMFVEAIGCHWNRDIPALVKQAGLQIIQDQQRVFGMVHSLEMISAQLNQRWQAADEANQEMEADETPAPDRYV